MTDTLCSFNMWVIFLFASLINELFAIPRVFISCSIYPDSHFFFHWSPSCLTAEKNIVKLHFALPWTFSNFSFSLPFIDILVYFEKKKGLKSFVKRMFQTQFFLKLIFPLFFLCKGFNKQIRHYKGNLYSLWESKDFHLKKSPVS